MADIDFSGGKALNLNDPKFARDGVNLQTLQRFVASSVTLSISTGTTKIVPGINTFTSGTLTNTSVNITGGSFNDLYTSGTTQFAQASAMLLSGGTLFSGGTNLYDIFSVHTTRVQPGSNIITGGTANNPIINVVASPFFDNLNSSGTSNLNIVTASTIANVNYVDFVTGNTIQTNVTGRIFYNNIEQALAYYPNANQDVIVNIGQQQYIRVNNISGTLVTKGSVVNAITASAGTPSITLALSTGTTGNNIIGLAAHNISNGSQGLILTNGLLSGLTINTFSVGDVIYLSDTTPGGYINDTSSLANSSRINEVGYITATGTTTGQIFVNINNENSNELLTIKQKNLLVTNTISTGIYSFTGLTKTSNTTFSVGQVGGWIVRNFGDNSSDYSIVNILYSGTTGTTTPHLATSDATYVLVTSSTTLSFQTEFPTPQQRRENLYLGKVIHPDRTTISFINNTVDYNLSPMSSIRDLWSPIKLINNDIIASPNGANLNINTTAGSLFGNGINWISNNLNPNSVDLTATTQSTFQYRTFSGTSSGFSNTQLIDPTNYDVGGVVTAIPGAVIRATNQRIFLFPTGAIRIQYGQEYYSSLTSAVSNIQSETFITNSNNSSTGILIGILSITKGAIDLSDTTTAIFISTSKFGELFGGTAGLSTTTLQQAYNNSVTPEIIINSTLDGLSIQNGTGNANNITHLLEGIDSSGVTTSFIMADGGFSGTSISANTINSGSTNINNIFAQGSGTTNTIPFWSSTRGLSDSILSQSSSVLTVNGSVMINGNVSVVGTATTFNTQTIQTSDNNLTMNMSGNHATAIGGGITILSGQPNGGSSNWLTDSNGNWSANTGIYTSGITAGVFTSGSTDLYNIFALAGSDTNDITRVQSGTNTYTGGTANNPTVNVVSNPSFGSITSSGASSFTTLSATTFISGSTDISTLFATPANIALINSQLATKANLSGATFTGTVNGTTISATTLNGGIILSGGTNLYSIFAPINSDTNDITRVQSGTNTYTGGTANNPTVNVSALTINTITASGASSFTTLSANTFISGSSEMSTLFATPANIALINSQLATKANLSGATFTGTVNGTTLNATIVNGTTLSGGTIYSGSSEVSTLFATPANITLINSQLLTKANLSGATFTGQVNGTIISATTISATTSTINNNYTSGALIVGANSNKGDFIQFTDTFDGSVVNANNWVASTGLTQNGNITMTGNSTWDTVGIISTQSYRRSNTLTLMTDVTLGPTSNNFFIVGLSQYSTIFHFPTHGLYFYTAGALYIYENGASIATSFVYAQNIKYRVKITTKENYGATYFISSNSGDTWTMLYDGSANTGTTQSPLYVLATVNSGTEVVDNISVSNGFDVLNPSQFFPKNLTIGNGNLVVSGNTVLIGATATTISTTTITGSTSLLTPQIYGSSAANGDITIEGTSDATKTTSYINLQPTGGNVGIGTTVPAAPLHVLKNQNSETAIYASNQFGGTAESSSLYALGSAGGYSHISHLGSGYTTTGLLAPNLTWLSGGDNILVGSRVAGKDLIFHTAGTAAANERMRILANGNVGIGTTAPVSKLNIAGTTPLTWTISANNSGLVTIGDGGTTGGSLYVNTAGLSPTVQSGFGVDGTHSGLVSTIKLHAFGAKSSGSAYGADMAFWTSNQTTESEKVRITQLGNVGIGTTAPASKLELSGTGLISNWTGAGTGIQYLKMQNTGAYGVFGIARSTTGGMLVGDLPYATVLGTANATALQFGTNNTANMTILNGGNVGIGTTAPNTKLNVGGIGNATLAATRPNSIWTNSASGNNSIGIISNGQADMFFNNTAGGVNAKWFQIYSVTGAQSGSLGFRSLTDALGVNNENLFLANSGNVGIGTTAPLSKLGVLGNLSIGATYGAIAAPTSGAIIEGSVGIGTPSALTTSYAAVTPVVSVANTSYAPFVIKTYSSVAARSPILSLAHSKGTTVGSELATADADVLGVITFEGVNTSNAVKFSSAIIGTQDGAGGATFIPGKLGFYTSTSAATLSERMTILSSGNVGIGTSTPLSKLEVKGLSFDQANSFLLHGAIHTSQYFISDNAHVDNRNYAINQNFTNYGMFEIRNSTASGGDPYTSGATRFMINKDGNVGIGTTAPNQALEVKGVIRVQRSNSTLSLSELSSEGGGMNIRQINAASAAYPSINFYHQNNTFVDFQSMFIKGTGEVGIGTTTPLSKLSINGGLHVGGDSDAGDNNAIIDGTTLLTGTLTASVDASISTLVVGRGLGSVATNTAIGVGVLASNTVGSTNTGLGYQALNKNTVGIGNIGISYQALVNNTASNYNTVVGYQAMRTLSFTNAGVSYASENVAIGVQSLFSMQPTVSTEGRQNTCIGSYSNYNNIIGSGNVSIGYLAGYRETGSNQFYVHNSITGIATLAQSRTQSLLWGTFGATPSAQQLTVNGALNTQLDATINGLTIGEGGSNRVYNTALGYAALTANTTGDYSVAIGWKSLLSNTTGYDNVAVGYRSLEANTTGFANTIFGAVAGLQNTIGNNNTSIGRGAGSLNITGSSNVNLGYAAGNYETGSNQFYVHNSVSGITTLALGRTQSLLWGTFGATPSAQQLTVNGALNTQLDAIINGLTVGAGNNSVLSNTLLGVTALGANTTGYYNTAVGNLAATSNIGGHYNTALGALALNQNTYGGENTAIGVSALATNINGNYNTAVGFNAGQASVGDSNVFIGYAAGESETGSNKLYISNTNTSTPLIGGDFSTSAITINGTIKITGGSPGAGKILTSDSVGLASWTAPTQNYEASLSLSSAQILNLFTTAITIVSGTGVGTYIEVISASIIYTYGSTTYIGNKSMLLVQGTNTIGILDDGGSTLTATASTIVNMIKVTAGMPGQAQIGENLDLKVKVAVANVTSGNGTAIVKVLYRIVTI